MTDNRHDPKAALRHAIKMRFGTAPSEPTTAQLAAIMREAKALGASLRDEQWAELVVRHCPSNNRAVYEGADNADLNTLLRLALTSVSSR
jgi:hypothetical protein